MSSSDDISAYKPWRDLEQDANSCPCPDSENLTIDDEYDKTWQIIYTCFVLLFMLVALLSDRVGADNVMVTALTLLMASTIISIEEGLNGFMNEGVMTVVILFVVAEGINLTGALDWYMGKLLGRPKTTAGAQLRLMIPVAIISAFLNNTPVVVVMIPIVQRWGKNIGVSPQQLLVPLSFASILGGTCTLIGTSTNLVIVGLLRNRYPDDKSLDIGLFDLGEYGVPVAIIGLTYILVASPFLLPGRKGSADIFQGSEQVLLGARLTPWSPAAGRSVKRSGLRDTGGIFLVSVHRAATGNMHRAVGQDFVLNVGDVLYFTGLVESFGEFCQEQGLEVMTNETSSRLPNDDHQIIDMKHESTAQNEKKALNCLDQPLRASASEGLSFPVKSEIEDQQLNIPVEIGITAASLIDAHETERLQTINRMTDQIRGAPREGDFMKAGTLRQQVKAKLRRQDPAQIVVTTDSRDSQRLVLLGINTHDRPGLLLDISKGLLRLHLQLRHTEASVVNDRSLSIWRCEVMKSELPDLEEVWLVLNALLEVGSGVQAMKKRGLRVIRVVIPKKSSLLGLTAAEANFRQKYKAAIIAVQKGGKNTTTAATFDVGDVLILQASDNSPLLKEPSLGFYDQIESKADGILLSRSAMSLIKMVNPLKLFTDEKDKATIDQGDLEGNQDEEGVFFIPGEIEANDEIDRSDISTDVPTQEIDASLSVTTELQDTVWRDLRVISADQKQPNNNDKGPQKEFLTAMEIAPNSKLAKRTVEESGLIKLSGVFLVTIERPVVDISGEHNTTKKTSHSVFSGGASSLQNESFADGSSIRGIEPKFITVDPDDTLEPGDVLWFSGTASAVGDLRKIPGLRSFDSDQVDKINEKLHDRRLVQAVVAKKGPLVGKTVRKVRFRTRYGAAVIAVHREGERVHDHPGRIKLHAGDVLLLEAGPTFIKRNAENDKSFALLAEVEDSAPPRLEKLIPALILTLAMLLVYVANVASLLVCALVASILMIVLGIMSEQEARDAVNWEVYVTIASAFGIGRALVNSGVAAGVADGLVFVGKALGIGNAGLFGAVYLATFLISNVVTNNAAAVLLFPIAMDAAEQTGADLRLMSYTLMLGASASFMSPFGYTTNLLIYGPGGYKFVDFLNIGTPMQIVLWIFSIVILSSNSFGSWLIWIICFTVFLVVAGVRLTNGTRGKGMTRKAKTNPSGTQEVP